MNVIQRRILDGIQYLIQLGAAEEVTITKDNITVTDPVTEAVTSAPVTATTLATTHSVEIDEDAESLAQRSEVIFIICGGPLDDQNFKLEVGDKITCSILAGGGEFRISDFLLTDGARAQFEVKCYEEGSVTN